MMKRILSFISMLFLAVFMLSCEKAEEPVTIDFGKDLYTIYAQGETTVEIMIGKAPASDLKIPLTFAGKAVKGTDYSISAEAVLIPAGETHGSVKIQEISLSSDKQISLGFITPTGYIPGNKIKTVISLSNEEALIYKFKMGKANLHESYIAEIQLTGVDSGRDFKAQEDLYIPLKLTGKATEQIHWESDTKNSPVASPSIIVPAGSNKGQVRLTCNENFKGMETAILEVNRPLNPRLIPADENNVQEITIWGWMTPDRLSGTWEFVKVYDLENVELFLSEDERFDPEQIPTHNQGFQLTIQGNQLIPNQQGDWADFFRKCEIALTKPKNICPGNDSFILGSYTAEEHNMFMETDRYNYVQTNYFSLSSANRTFDSKNEKLGESVIAISMIDQNTIQIQFRDYDRPPFDFMWSDQQFDPQYFGFASEFKKIK